MKGYYGKKELRYSGKGWEIRHQLKQAAKRAGPGATLQQWLEKRSAGKS